MQARGRLRNVLQKFLNISSLQLVKAHMVSKPTCYVTLIASHLLHFCRKCLLFDSLLTFYCKIVMYK